MAAATTRYFAMQVGYYMSTASKGSVQIYPTIKLLDPVWEKLGTELEKSKYDNLSLAL